MSNVSREISHVFSSGGLKAGWTPAWREHGDPLHGSAANQIDSERAAADVVTLQGGARELSHGMAVRSPERRRVQPDGQSTERVASGAFHVRTLFARAAVCSSRIRAVSASRTRVPSDVIR